MINNETDAFVIIDVQNDFCPGGALAVEDGHAVVAPINALSKKFDHRILTQDWHPAGHSSFASSHEAGVPFALTQMPYGPQTLWPDHCVQGSDGAEFHPDLEVTGAGIIIRKGFRSNVDSYSAFFENDQTTPTGLTGYLRERGFTRVFVAGLATDFCVAFSAIDASRQGFTTFVIEDASRAIDMAGSLAAAHEKMVDADVTIIQSTDL
ncbi:bifunctional nicotinamidase/pyrazinamidase [Labrenzia sp. OB1]|uniref:bifunctional nicotinamidase/pyrazinamidase n=1 Tax=Labrenzia sp. OB1 TaxID=1561204 RepID=UPI0007B21E53|nr:bifunctional nicotinamidase/pyrazinamidase [Labrenzia sp. OB1]KZM50077.1 hypothetical protein OA90_11895 [Labrenzia sp. OB1]